MKLGTYREESGPDRDALPVAQIHPRGMLRLSARASRDLT